MKTILDRTHRTLGARITDFAGWEMPLNYGSVVQEHMAVREDVGIFDVSHMGRLLVQGPQAEAFLDYVSCNQIKGKKVGSATYTVLPAADGGSVDDVIIYRDGIDRFFLVVNASNRQKDLQHLIDHGQVYDVLIGPDYEDDAIFAVQGPNAQALVAEHMPEVAELKPMRHHPVTFQGVTFPAAATGYTGSGGVELYPPRALAEPLWEVLTASGARPCGLGARDTLRMEMGFALYGHELSDTIPVTESVSAWTVKLGKDNFLGKEALSEPPKCRQVGLQITDRGIARQGALVFDGDLQVGEVTSGTHSPSLGYAIAIASIGVNCMREQLQIEVRGRRLQAQVVKLPFYTKP